MKFALFICISLLASLLHAAAMPIVDVGEVPINNNVELAQQHSPEQHQRMMHDEHHDAKNICHDSGFSCCMAVALQPSPQLPLVFLFSEEMYTSLPLVPPRPKPETIYRPPKLYPVFVG